MFRGNCRQQKNDKIIVGLRFRAASEAAKVLRQRCEITKRKVWIAASLNANEKFMRKSFVWLWKGEKFGFECDNTYSEDPLDSVVFCVKVGKSAVSSAASSDCGERPQKIFTLMKYFLNGARAKLFTSAVWCFCLCFARSTNTDMAEQNGHLAGLGSGQWTHYIMAKFCDIKYRRYLENKR